MTTETGKFDPEIRVGVGEAEPSAFETALRDQLVRLLESRCVDPLELLLDDAETAAALRTRVRQHAADWARAMTTTPESDNKRHEQRHQYGDDGGATTPGVQVIMRLIAGLYPSDEPFDPPTDWWRTPFGQVVAHRLGHPGAVRVSYAVAGAMLGISRQGVHDLINRGKLDRHPEGGVTPSSVRRRLRQQAGTGSTPS